MFDGLDAFSDDLTVERFGQPQYTAQNGKVVGVVEHVADKALVDFELIDRKTFQVGQRRVTGAEVVQRKQHTDFPARFDDLRDARDILDGTGFQNLHFEIARWNGRMARQDVAQPDNKVFLEQLPCGEVDADRQAEFAGPPAFHLTQRFFDDPFAQLDGERMVLDGREENRGRQHAPLRVLPADQGFGSDDLPGAHVHLGLIMQNEFTAHQSGANVFDAFVESAQRPILFGIEHVVAVAPGQLGLVHGLVGLAQQVVGIDCLGLRVEGDTDAR